MQEQHKRVAPASCPRAFPGSTHMEKSRDPLQLSGFTGSWVSAQGAEDKNLPLRSPTASGEFFPSRELSQRGKAATQLLEISALDGQDHRHKGLKRKT